MPIFINNNGYINTLRYSIMLDIVFIALVFFIFERVQYFKNYNYLDLSKLHNFS